MELVPGVKYTYIIDDCYNASPLSMRSALETLKGRARIKRTMWSRRAQEYEAKINSGDIVAIAEVVRDLFRSDTQPEQSYSERQLYEAALDRLSREIAAVQRVTETEAVKEIEVWKADKRLLKAGFRADLVVSVPKGQADRIKAELLAPQPLLAPVAEGQRVGLMRVSFDGKPFGEYPVVALEAAAPAGIFGRAWDTLRLWLK